jgi:hypothetical protein
MKVRIDKKKLSKDIEKNTDIALAAEMAIKILKTDPMIVGEPVAEVSPGCPMGFANPKVTLHYDIISPSIFDKFKMILTKTSLNDIIKENKRGNLNGI